jgi:uncharacterized protein
MDVATLGLVKTVGAYAALITLMGVVLTFVVINQRRTKLIGIGDGGDKTAARMIRVHGNFFENAPFALALLILLALTGGPKLVIHLVGAMFVVGRALHAVGLSGSAGSSPGRIAGMLLTLTSFLIGATTLIVGALSG